MFAFSCRRPTLNPPLNPASFQGGLLSLLIPSSHCKGTHGPSQRGSIESRRPSERLPMPHDLDSPRRGTANRGSAFSAFSGGVRPRQNRTLSFIAPLVTVYVLKTFKNRIRTTRHYNSPDWSRTKKSSMPKVLVCQRDPPPP